MKILVCGGRDYGNLVRLNHDRNHADWAEKEKEYNNVMRMLDVMSLEWPRTPEDEYGNWLSIVTIISGSAPGADACGIDWAVVNWCDFEEYPAEWKTYGDGAGPIRNQQMLDKGKPDLVVAFPGGKGTADMVRKAEAAGIEVRKVE